MVGLGSSKINAKKLGTKRKNKKKKRKNSAKRKSVGSGGRLKVDNGKAFQKIMKKTKEILKKSNPSSELQAVKIALKTAKKSAKREKKRGKIIIPRVIPLPPQSGGFLAILPIISAISALGSAFGGVAGIVKSISEIRNIWQKYKESKKEKTEINPVQVGQGLKIAKHKKGLALYFL